MSTPQSCDVLEFWLGSSDGETPPPEVRKRWWTKDPAFDREIRERFGDLHERACAGELDGWTESPRGTLALVILLDQFSRNLHRGNPRSWSSDDKTQSIVEGALERGLDQQLAPYERLFLYMPLMHAEDLGAQVRCIEKMKELAETAGQDFAGNVDYAKRHHAIIERFGRFPHRNEILGRHSTDEEKEFLTQPGSSF
jgi:uncharacterized protein (DUF924 family)